MEREDTEQRNQEINREDKWRSISRDTAEFLSVFARSINAKCIVEFGTSHGYSTIWLGLVAKSMGGKVISFEIVDWRYQQAIRNVRDAGLDNY